MEKTPLVVIQGTTTMIVTEGRRMTRQFVTALRPRLFLLEMLATFHLCAGFNVLRPLVEMEPKPQAYLGHIYSFVALHFYLTLSENPSNPTTTLVNVLRKGISMKLGVVKIVAQFFGAFLAVVYRDVLWARGILELLADPHLCSHPLQTGLLKAFGTELVSAFMFQLTVLKSEEQEIRVRANVLAVTMTSLIYAGL
ncbi:aquaporin-11-like [Anolis sagrei]|uniref:aquaporin-11-like n=1 Tax=Anolis sagrei TaxID=38937 RepID=UPI003520A53A